jgi:hypothetical protein
MLPAGGAQAESPAHYRLKCFGVLRLISTFVGDCPMARNEMGKRSIW